MLRYITCMRVTESLALLTPVYSDKLIIVIWERSRIVSLLIILNQLLLAFLFIRMFIQESTSFSS